MFFIPAIFLALFTFGSLGLNQQKTPEITPEEIQKTGKVK